MIRQLLGTSLRWLAHTAYHAELNTRGMVSIEAQRQLAEAVTDWSPPVQVRFQDTGGKWEMHVRTATLNAQVVREAQVKAALQ